MLGVLLINTGYRLGRLPPRNVLRYLWPSLSQWGGVGRAAEGRGDYHSGPLSWEKEGGCFETRLCERRYPEKRKTARGYLYIRGYQLM